MSSPSLLRSLLADKYRVDSRDEDVQRRGRALITVLITFAATLSSLAVVTFIFAPPDRRTPSLVALAVLMVAQLISGLLARRGRVDAGGLLLSGALSLTITAYQLHVGAYTDFLWSMALSVVIASITVRPRLIWLALAVNLGLLVLLAGVLPQSTTEKIRVTAMVTALVLPIAVFTYFSAARTHAIFTAQAAAMRALELAKTQLDAALVVAQEQRHRAEAANRAKSTFLANMSHELRTPLNAIIGYAELLAEDSPGAAADDLRKIQRSGEHLVAIISDILDLSRVEAGKLTLQPERVDLFALVRELREAVAPLVALHRNALVIDHDPACAALCTDPLRHKQILLNLLANAAKFTEDGTITLRIAIAADAHAVRFDVIDTGIGMDEAALSRVFDDFTQADGSSTRKYGGTGLGLSLSRRLARLLGASLTATSAPGEGSTFTLIIPSSPPEADGPTRTIG